ncbi:MAG: hypothetical protein GY930_06705 [bacterium]|nr:hypothetical protein [bacterium]
MTLKRKAGCAIFMVGLALLVLLSGIAIKERGRSNLAHELERIRAAGEPLLPEDIDFRDPGEGHNRREWLVRFGEEFEELYPPVLWDPEGLFWDTEEDDSEDWEEDSLTEHKELFRTAIQEGRTREDLVAEVWSALADPRLLAQCSPFVNNHFRTARTVLADAIPRALEIVQCAGLDLETITASALDVDEDGRPSIYPVLPISESIAVMKILGATLRQACLEGDEKLAHQLLLAAFDNADAYAGSGSAHQIMTWNLLEYQALDMLEDALFFLPLVDHLPDLEQELEKVRPLHFGRQMFVSERAFGRRAYQWWGDLAGDEVSIWSTEGLVCEAFQEWDELAYLEMTGRFIHEFDRSRPTWEMHAALGREGAMETPPSWSLLCKILSMNSSMLLTQILYSDCRLTLARIALVSQRNGRDAALALAKATLDPFDGKPLRWREEEDGTILFWSVGADLIDDGGAHPGPDPDQREPDDITWRVKPR